MRTISTPAVRSLERPHIRCLDISSLDSRLLSLLTAPNRYEAAALALPRSHLSVVNMRQYRRRLHHGSRFSAAISKASIATSHAVVSCTDLGSVKICRLASSSVRSVLPSGKTTGRSRRLSQDTTQLRNRTLDTRKRGGDSFRRPAVAGPRGPIDPVSSCWISSYWMFSAARRRYC